MTIYALTGRMICIFLMNLCVVFLGGCAAPEGVSKDVSAPKSPPSSGNSLADLRNSMKAFGDSVSKSIDDKVNSMVFVIYGYQPGARGYPADRAYCLMDGATGNFVGTATKGEIRQGSSGRFIVAGQSTVFSCDKLKLNSDFVVTGYKATDKAADRLHFRNIMGQYDEDRPLVGQYPRVAITVHKSPMDWDENMGLAKRYALGCWRLSLVIWESDKKSRKIEPFQYCLPQDGSDEIAAGEGTTWAIRADRDAGYLTGLKRTNGPIPPGTVFPMDRQTQELALQRKVTAWQSHVGTREFSRTSLGVMFATLRFQLGARDTGGISHDMRVWITSVDD